MRASAENGLSLLPDQSVSGVARTASARKYLQQLCKHWSHKAEVNFDADEGHVSFPDGSSVTLKADDNKLTVAAVTGPRGDLARWQNVIEDHLVRFAYREELKIDWSE
nr:DUF2218 domain-containing protein [Ruegeria lacuscaerulensis]